MMKLFMVNISMSKHEYDKIINEKHFNSQT